MRISGRILLLIAIVITAISALFCIVGLATKGWTTVDGSLFCSACPKTPAALSVISFILLIISIITLVLLMFDFLNGVLRYVPIIILFIATLFLLATFASFYQSILGYSYNLVVVAHFFAYTVLVIVAYWLGQVDATSGSTG